jgi:hypothetical protein
MNKALLNTKPSYTKCHATEDGWVDDKTGEVLVSIKNLKTRLGEKRKPGRPKKIQPMKEEQ